MRSPTDYDNVSSTTGNNNAFRANLWKAYAFKFLRGLQFVGGVHIPFFLGWGKITFTQVMILQSIYILSVFLLEVPTGAIADRFGRKASLALSAITTAAAVLLYSWIPNFYVFALAEIVWAAGFALQSGADQAFVYDTLKKIRLEKDSKRVFGRLQSAELAALMIGGPLGSIIAVTLGTEYAMRLMAIPFFLAFLLAMFAFKEPEFRRQKSERKRYLELFASGIKHFRKNRVLKILAFDSISIAVLAFFLVWTYQLVLQDLGVPILYFGMVQAALVGSQMLVIHSFGFLEKFSGSGKRYLFLSAIAMGVGFILLGLNRGSIPAAIILIVAISGFGISREVLFHTYTNRHIPSGTRATVISTMSMIKSLIKGVCYPLVGLLVDGWSLSGTLIIIGILAIICAAFSRVEEGMLIQGAR